MARRRKDNSPEEIKLRQPDRSGPSEETLIEWATKRDLFSQADAAQQAATKKKKKRRDSSPSLPANVTKVRIKPVDDDGDDDGDDEADTNDDDDDDDGEGLTPTQERVMDCFLWSVSLTMVHFTLDVFVHNQYGQELEWGVVVRHTPPAFFVLALLFWVLHETPANPVLVPRLPVAWQHTIRQLIFLSVAISAGCFVIHITNNYGYLSVMQQAPITGVLWIWSVMELDLAYAVLSVAVDGGFLWYRGYSIM